MKEQKTFCRNEKPLPYEKETPIFRDYAIRFENVSFRYTDDAEVLQGISFTVKPGATTALIGPSGSGKTAIASLISRFWDVTDGRITVGGEGIRNISPDGLTRQMAVVFQDVYLLHDSIANNIRAGKANASTVIAHRLGTIKKADNILVLDGGDIREQGTHAELLSWKGWYARMIAEQEKAQNRAVSG